jgi:hypothetical protein
LRLGRGGNLSPMNMKYTTRKVFPSVGRCIYCGSLDDLSREHIIPYSLAGDYILPDASCPRCREVTRQEELWAARGMFGPIRLAHRFPTRHKHERPTHMAVEIESSGRSERIEVPIDQAPTTPIPIPLLPPPGIVVGREPSIEVPGIAYRFVFPFPGDHAERLQRLKQEGRTAVHMQIRFGLNNFMCLLAKIGHGFAVAAHGLEGFSPLLPDYILDKDRRLSHVVGSTTASIILPPVGTPGLDVETASHAWTVGIRSVGGKHYVAVLIQLFRYLNFPVYEVIAGEASPGLVREVLGT